MSKLSEFFEMYAYGEVGKSIFHEPFNRGVFGTSSDVGNLISNIFQTGDDRSKALVAAMVCETCIDGLLCVLLPKYHGLLSEANGFTFSTKIKLLQSFGIVPDHLTTAADLLRQVRNTFAHKLHVDSFTQLDKKTVDKLRGLYIKRKIKTDARSADVGSLFESSAMMATAWLNMYRVNLEAYSRTVRSPEFLELLQKENDGRVELELTRLLASLPPSAPNVESS